MDALCRMGEASQIRLADEFGLTAASMSTMTTRLVKAGLIEKRVDKLELRSNVLTLTPRGKKLLKAIYREWNALDGEISNAIGSNNSERLGYLTHNLRDALGGKTPGRKSADVRV